MEIAFTNNSVSGINRRYRGFNFELPGLAKEKIINVPRKFHADLIKYLRERHPAVVIVMPQEDEPNEPVMATEVQVAAEMEESPEGEGTEQEESPGEEEAESQGPSKEGVVAPQVRKKNTKKGSDKKKKQEGKSR